MERSQGAWEAAFISLPATWSYTVTGKDKPVVSKAADTLSRAEDALSAGMWGRSTGRPWLTC